MCKPERVCIYTGYENRGVQRGEIPWLWVSNRGEQHPCWHTTFLGKYEQTAREGLNAMETWMKELGLVMNISDLGATEDMLEGIADGTIILPGGYKVLKHDEIVEILKESLK